MDTCLLYAVTMNGVGTLVLLGVFYYLYRQKREPHTLIWTVAWSLQLLSYLITAVTQIGGNTPFLHFFNQAAAALSALALYCGTAVFIERRINRGWFVLTGAILAWVAVADLLGLPFPLISAPVFVLLASVFLWTAWTILRSPLLPATAPKYFTVVSFALWGVHKLDYPLLAQHALAPWGHLLSAVFALCTAFGILLMYYEKVNRELIDSETRFTNALLSAASGMVIVDLDGRIVRANQAFINMLGYPEDELYRRSFRDFTALEDLQTEERLLEELLDGSRPSYRLEKRFIGRDNRMFWVTVNVSLVRDSHGAPHFFFGQVNNIQQRKKLEATLRKQEELLNSTGRLARVGGWEVDLASGRVHWTSVTKEIHEVAPDFEPTLENAIAFYVVEDRPVIRAAVERAIAEGTSFDLELRIVTAKGNLLWVHAIGTPDFDAGKCTGLHGMFQDISEQKQQRDELTRKNAELERFTYTVSHDLKAPLVTIGGFVSLLEKHLADSGDQRARSALEYIREATEKMSALLSELLELSRAGRMVELTPGIDMELLIHETLDTYAVQLAEKNIEVQVADNLPPVTGDRNRLAQVLQNLVGNAIKFTGKQRNPQIEIGYANSPRGHAFYVRDNGIGIDPQHQEKAFGLFERLDPETEGTGVGLALVSRIVELHGGTCWIESEGAGRGTTVWFTLATET